MSSPLAGVHEDLLSFVQNIYMFIDSEHLYFLNERLARDIRTSPVEGGGT